MLDARPDKLLGLPAGAPITQQQQEQATRIHDKVRLLVTLMCACRSQQAQVWTQVERIIGDLRSTLGKRLRDTRRNLDEVEKTIECARLSAR